MALRSYAGSTSGFDFGLWRNEMSDSPSENERGKVSGHGAAADRSAPTHRAPPEPRDPERLNQRALVARELEHFDEAGALLGRSLALDPNKAGTFAALALVRLKQNRIAEAQSLAQRALLLAPDNPEAINAMGLVRFGQQKTKEALTLFRRAAAIDPTLADAHNNIANILKEDGHLVEARQAYEQAVTLNPREFAYYANLADVKHFATGDAQLAAMETLARDPDGLPDIAQLRLNFALAKAYDDLDRFDEAFACMRRANVLKRRRLRYDEAGTFALFDRIAEVFDRPLLNAKAGHGFNSALPVFVVGMPRSGTSLVVEQIVASHPAVHGGGELMDFNVQLLRIASSGGTSLRYPDDAAALAASQLHALGKAYACGLRPRAPHAERMTDKMPANFLFLGLIHLALPGARIIHVRRDPRDICLSCYSKLFNAEQNFAYDLGELARYIRKYAELMAHWRGVLPPSTLLEIRYEDIVADLEGSARRRSIIAACLGIPNSLSFHETKRPVRTASAAAGAAPDLHQFGRALAVLSGASRPGARRAGRRGLSGGR